MRYWMGMPIAAVIALSACVTINVYFPAAEAKEAAKEFVEKVIGDEIQAAPAPGGGMAGIRPLHPCPDCSVGFDPLMLIGIAPAHAQAPDITLKTPAIQSIQSRMESRFDSTLRAHFDSGALGFTDDGLVAVREASKISLGSRVGVNQAVAEQNRDAKAVYREVAVANGHAEWEGQIREVFAKQWVESAHDGWWYQSGGAWKKK
ncbi:MAG: DUF1318 domain-containing protein [Luteimonas sp.]